MLKSVLGSETSTGWSAPGNSAPALQLCNTASVLRKYGLSCLLLRMHQRAVAWQQFLLRFPPASQICKSDVNLVTEGWRGILNSRRHEMGWIWLISFLFLAVLNEKK